MNLEKISSALNNTKEAINLNESLYIFSTPNMIKDNKEIDNPLVFLYILIDILVLRYYESRTNNLQT